MKIEIETRLEVVRLILQSPALTVIDHAGITEAADNLTKFVLNGTQELVPETHESVIELITEDLNSQGSLAHALEKWIVRSERLRAAFRGSRQKEPISPLGLGAAADSRQGRRPNKH